MLHIEPVKSSGYQGHPKLIICAELGTELRRRSAIAINRGKARTFEDLHNVLSIAYSFAGSQYHHLRQSVA